MFAGQRPDGGWTPFWAPDYSSLDATCYHLAQAEPLGLLATTAAGGHALDLLRDRQQIDGAWQENASSDVKLPPWLTPNDPATIRYLTANCGLWLTLRPQDAQACERAAAFLETSLQALTVVDPPHFAWLVAGLWHACGKIDRAEQALQQLAIQRPQLSAATLGHCRQLARDTQVVRGSTAHKRQWRQPFSAPRTCRRTFQFGSESIGPIMTPAMC